MVIFMGGKIIYCDCLKTLPLTNEFLNAKLLIMKRLHKKIVSAFLLIPLLFVITVCCCLDEKVLAAESDSSFSTEHHHGSHELEKVDHTEHQNHAEGDHECVCPKHLSFLSAQSVDLAFNSVSQLLAKDFMANLRIENIVLLASLSNHSQGPPWQEHLDRVSIPIYLKISNLRI